MALDGRDPSVSIVLPCRNEEKTLGLALATVKTVLQTHDIAGEIIVSDSSTDNSPGIAQSCDVRLIKHDQNGYGRAYIEAFKAAKGKYIFMADPDGSYDLREIPRFLDCLYNGSDFVVGNRFKGNIQKGAMPWHHRYIGNPFFSLLLRLLFGAKLHDVHCGMRAISRQALDKLKLKTPGMEFASEMVIKAAQARLSVKELPIDYRRREGRSKLRPLADGWRHLRFILRSLKR